MPGNQQMLFSYPAVTNHITLASVYSPSAIWPGPTTGSGFLLFELLTGGAVSHTATTVSGGSNTMTPTTNWYTPGTAGIGTSYWAMFVQDSASAGVTWNTSGAAYSTWVNITATLSWGINANINVAGQTAQGTVYIAANSGGSPILATATINFSVTN